MRIVTLLLFLATLLVSVPSFAEPCGSGGTSGRWTAIGTVADGLTWSGCAASADDNFTVASGSRVYVDGTVTATTGDVTVASGGTLIVSAGSTLNPGLQLVVQTGGRLEILGDKISTCRISTQIDWSAADPILTLDCPVSGAGVVGTDYLVFGEEDPAGGDFTGKVVNTKPGFDRGAFNTSPARYSWFDITAVGANTATIDFDQSGMTFAGTPNIPYMGTRGHTSGAGLATATITHTSQPGRRATLVTIPNALGSVANRNADLGGRYLYFNEDTDNSGDSTFCSGKQAKILHSEDGGGGADLLFVAGDTTGCTSLTTVVRITNGARRGDLVHLVRPATIQADQAGVPTAHVIVESGAVVDWKWARFVLLDDLLNTVPEPDVFTHCNLCFIQSSGSPTAAITGRIEDVEVVQPAPGATDSAIWGFYGAQDGDELRFPNDGMLDLQGLAIRRVHTHDAQASTSGSLSGAHGMIPAGVKNLQIDGFRAERLSDDLIAGTLVGNLQGDGTTLDRNSITLLRGIAYEGIAETDNSQSCFDLPSSGNYIAQGGLRNVAHQAGAWRVTDIIGAGCFDGVLATSAVGSNWDKIVLGGSVDPDTSAAANVTSSYADDGETAIATFPNTWSNALVTSYTEDGTTATDDMNFNVNFVNSVYWGDEQSAAASAGYEIGGIQSLRESFISHTGAAVTFQGAGAPLNAFNAARSLTDSAVFSTSAGQLGANFGAATRTVTVTRFLYAAGLAWSAGNGPLGLWGTDAGVTWTINGMHLTTGTLSVRALAVNNGGLPLSDVCLENNGNAAAAFTGGALSSTTITTPDLKPDTVDTNIAVGELVGNPASINICDRARPINIGLRSVGMSHVLLGDFSNEQLYPIYTSRSNILFTTGGSTGGGGRCAGAWPCN